VVVGMTSRRGTGKFARDGVLRTLANSPSTLNEIAAAAQARARAEDVELPIPCDDHLTLMLISLALQFCAPDAPSTSTRLINLLLPPSAQTSLSSLLPLNSPSQHHTTLLKAHHASILFSLHASLTSAGSTLSDLQEDRAKRLAEASSRSLGGGLAFLMGESESGGTGGLGAGQGRGQGAGGIIGPKAPVRQEEEGEKALSQEQMMLFESENARLLEGYNDHLEQVRFALPLYF
jgi:hypothetical protein